MTINTPRFLFALFAVALGSACASNVASSDGFEYKYGQMYVNRDGYSKAMQDDMKTNNGLYVRTDGVVIEPGGNQFRLTPGETLSFDGILTHNGQVPVPVAVSTTVVTTSTATSAPIATASDCVLMRDGRVLEIRGGQAYPLDGGSLRLGDGTVVTSGGTVNTPDGRTMTMRDGDTITLDGRTRKLST